MILFKYSTKYVANTSFVRKRLHSNFFIRLISNKTLAPYLIKEREKEIKINQYEYTSLII